MCQPFILKANPGPGMCPVKGCRKRRGQKKTLCNTHASRLWRMQNPVRAAFNNARHHARQRRIPFTLTFEYYAEFVTKSGYIEGKGCQGHHLHLDRIDETLGYEVGNVQVLTCSDNVAKENRKRYVPYFSGGRSITLKRLQPKFEECPF